MLNLETTVVLEKNMAAYRNPKKRRALNEGGTSSSKTYSILQLLILIASHTKENLLVSIVSESLPHLKRGCIRDFKAIMGDTFDENKYNKTDFIYNFNPGVIEFFPADMPSKMRGGRRQILFINECNNVPYDAFRELDVRTEQFTFLDWNPVSEFWVHDNGMLDDPANEYIHSTYRDAVRVLPPEYVRNIESNKDKDPNWWNVYGLGLLGRIEGLVYHKFELVDALPRDGDTVYGIDFGFSGDPTVLVRNVFTHDSVYSEELIYEVGLTNQDITQKMSELGLERGGAPMYADSAEPKSIEELKRDGWNIKPVDKAQGSVEYGHQRVRQLKQFWTKASLNCIKEQRNFKYVEDKDGKLTEKTTHRWSHGMDARRYATMMFKNSRLKPRWRQF